MARYASDFLQFKNPTGRYRRPKPKVNGLFGYVEVFCDFSGFHISTINKAKLYKVLLYVKSKSSAL